MKYYVLAVAIAVVAIVVGVWLPMFLRKRRLMKIGKVGEKKVAGVLKSFALPRSYKVINDLYLPLYDKTTQVDHVLIGFFGILVVETKAVSGEVYGDPKKKDWLHITGSSKHPEKQKRYEMYNPLMQNQAHVDCIRHILGLENLYNINIESLVVFTAKKVDLYMPNKLPIIRLKKLKRFLRQDRFEKDQNYDVDKLYEALMKHQVTDKARIADHVKNVKKMAKGN